MNKCCPECFADRQIKKLINASPIDELGNCPHCHGEDKKLVPCNILTDTLEFLPQIAVECPDGKPIHELIQDSFEIFSSNVQNKENLYNQIALKEKSTNRYKIKFNTEDYKLGWQALRNELKSINRFFPSQKVYTDLFLSREEEAPLFSILDQLEKKINAGARYFRARISDDALSNEKMGPPPSHLASAGRANPKGISYLYLANNKDTCISEVRPYKGCDVYVSEFNNTIERRLIDLTNPRKHVSPILVSEDLYQEVLSIIDLLEVFSNELTLPVKPHLSELDYIPTQFLCEFIKSLGYDGIVYKSSFGKGVNYVFFTTNDFDIAEPALHTVNDIAFSYS